LWKYIGQGPAVFPSVGDLVATLKLYVMRDVGWFWILFAGLGFIAGFIRKNSRYVTLVVGCSILVLLLYLSGWYFAAKGDVTRYLIPTIPMTLIGIGFLYKEISLLMKVNFLHKAIYGFFVVWYVFLGFVGIYTDDPLSISQKPSVKKFLFMPQYQLSNLTRIRYNELESVLQNNALGLVAPRNSIVLNHVTNWSSPLFFLDVYPVKNRFLVYVDDSSNQANASWYDEKLFKKSRWVFSHPSLKDVQIDNTLERAGFTMSGAINNIKIFGNQTYQK